MPSSSEVDETATFSSPFLSLSSTSSLVTLLRLPWWAARSCTPLSMSLKETCSVPLLVFVKMSVVL